MRNLRWLLAICLAVALPSTLAGQQPTTITGTVRAGGGAAGGTQTGQPLSGVSVFVPSLNIGTLSNQEGRYTLVIPASRAQGQRVTLSASLIGYQTASTAVTLAPGAVTQNFVLTEDPLRLEEVVVTGQGTRTTREALGVTVTSVNAEEVVNSQETNVISALAGKAPGVQVTTSSGEPGAGAYIQIRGANTIYGGTQPLIVVDGMPINNNSYAIGAGSANPVAGTAIANRAVDLNPNDIESIEVLKGAAAGAIYGSRAASGVVLITTKSGRAGGNRVSFKSGVSWENVNQMQPLQVRHGQGLDATAFSGLRQSEMADWFCYWLGECELSQAEAVALANDLRGVNLARTYPASWGPALACASKDPATGKVTDSANCQEGRDFFDHGTEIFRTGMQFENNLTMSGGTNTTTYYLSVGRSDHQGVIDGNSSFNRTNARLKGSHAFTPELTISGNFFYADSDGDLIQQGSNISGLLLGALRTPPEFNNCLPETCYRDPNTGLHRSYRNPNPSSLTQGRGYDNPFWVAREITNTTDVARTISSVELSYQPFGWLNVNGNVGADVVSDNRLSVWPKSSSEFPQGQMIRANFTQNIYDASLVATATRTFSDRVAGSLALGANVNQDTYKRYEVEGKNLIQGTDQLDFTVDKIPNETFQQARTAGYFTQANLDLFDQLFFTGAVRLDGSNTFGAQADQWHLYPKFTAAWNFTDLPGWQQNELLNFGKLRFAWGVTGKQPPIYTNVTAFQVANLGDSWLNTGLRTIYQGFEGVFTEGIQGNAGIRPEKTTGFDAGVDLSFFNNRVNFGLTYYDENTEDVILDVDVPRSTGFSARWDNAAAISNKGWELQLGVRPVETPNFGWNIDAQWATNESCVNDLASTEFIFLAGFTEPGVGLLRPDRDENGNVTRCYEYNTFYGLDFVRFGRGIEIGGQNIDQAFPNAPAGALYIGADGFPLMDSQKRALGDANPDWTAGLRSTFTFFRRLTVSALVDVNEGSRMWNGTKGALYFFGTHADVERFQAAGDQVVFGESFYPGETVDGPGAGQEVPLNWVNWFQGGIGSGFTGPSSPYIEDASFVKLRDVSIGLNIDRDWFRPLSSLGFSSADLMLVGRNLKTWTDYTGLDPESNLTSQTAGRGLEYFNNPRVRAWTFTVTLNR